MGINLPRLARISCHVGAYYGHSLAAKLTLSDPLKKRRFFTRNTGRHSGRLLDYLGFRIATELARPDLLEQPHFIVCNHMSYFDILVTSSRLPSVFVTSTDVLAMPFLGTMSEFGGSIFVDRRNRARLPRDIGMIGTALDDGFNVVLYPEGTTSDGSAVLPFRSSLFSAALACGRPILPMCIKYKSINHEPFAESNRDLICWYGDMSFVSHYLEVPRVRHVEVELTLMEPIEVTPKTDRRQLALQTETMIRATYHKDHVPWPAEPEEAAPLLRAAR